MKRVVLVALLTVFSLSTFADELSPKELSFIRYHDSGKYEQDIDKAITGACNYLKERMESGERLAIVMDIDETILSNFPNMRNLHFSSNKEVIATAYLRGVDPAINPTKKLFDFAKQHDVAIFFVTGRPNLPETKATTIANLRSAGITGWDNLYLRPVNKDLYGPVANYKSGIRQQIEEMGYKVVLNIGDQQSDLDGGHAEKAIKLPNPFYSLS